MSNPDPAPAPIVDADTIREIADGVWVIPDHRVPLVPNIGIILGEDAALVVDTGMGRRNGHAVLDAARRLAGKRRLMLTLTHFHPEHGYGAEAFEAAHVLYNRAQAVELETKGAAYLDLFRSMGPAIAEALEAVTLIGPHEVYDSESRSLSLGGRRVELRTWGKAHTKGDQVVHLPAERILFTGDLAEERTFPIFPWFPPDDTDIDGANWVRALEECLALQPQIVVPGHGEIGGPAILLDVAEYIRTMADRVARAKAKGLDRDAVVAEVEPLARADHPDWHFPEWIAFAAQYHYDSSRH